VNRDANASAHAGNQSRQVNRSRVSSPKTSNVVRLVK
jgi:hypothetical protein